MTTPRRPVPRKGSSIRAYHTAEQVFGLQVEGGKVYKFATPLPQPKLVYQGIERREERDRRDPANDRRSEWKDPAKAGSTGIAYNGRRANPWRKYDPIKDLTIPRTEVASLRQEAAAFMARTMKKKRLTKRALIDSLRREFGGTYYVREIIVRPNKYVLRLDLATNQLTWSSTRRRDERRKSNRRTTQQFATHYVDPTMN